MMSDSDRENCGAADALAALDRIHAATAGSATLDDMLLRILDEILEIFDCDRAFLIYPCLLDADRLRIFLERTKPEWPGAGHQDAGVPINDSTRPLIEACLNGDGPVRFDALSSPVAITRNEAMRAFHVRSQLVMALRPKGDDPWALGIHHCAQAHVYEGVVPLFRAIGNHVADAIGGAAAIRSLRQNEERFRSIVENSPLMLTLKNPDGVYTVINPVTRSYIEATGGAVGEGEASYDAWPADIGEAIRERDRAVIEDKCARTVEVVFPTADGELVVKTTKFPIMNAEGEVAAIGTMGIDITREREAEDKLRDSEERFRTLVEYAPEAITMIDVDTGLYVDANPMAEVLHGISRDALIGKRGPADLGPEIQLDGRPASEAALDYLNRALAGEFPRFEWMHMTPDGQETLCEVSLARMPDPHRNLVCASISDITERKQAEQELARLNAELERRVEERTAELREAQAELVRSERLATLGQLTATVSHELRNPLGAMRTSMYVVEKKTGDRDENITRAIDRVNRNITRCDQIIDELLDYTRIGDLELQSLSIDDWLASVLDEQPVPEGVSVRRKLGAPGLRVPADSDRLRRAVINVFENGCQALTGMGDSETPGEKKWLSVETHARKDRLEIVLSDNGPGIPHDLREKVFEPLFSTKNFGVGLGLPTVHQIMQQHGGGVVLSHRSGGGASFALWLPLAREANGVSE